MPLTRSAKTFVITHAPSRLRPLRPITPNCRGGASSLLRLAPPGAQRLPTTLDLSDWISRAAAAC